MHAYTVYGLGLHSEFPIPELVAEPGAPADIVVRQGPVAPAWLTPDVDHDDPDTLWSQHDRALNETVLGFGHVGRYWVRGGHEVVMQPVPGVEHDLTRHMLLGPVLAHVLWQRDFFTMHASVLRIHGHHVAFVGVSGEGKSTTAAALDARGHGLVCDDIAALQERDGAQWVMPAFPRMRLYEDVVRGVGDDPARHPQVHSLIEKRSKQAARFVREPVQLERIFVLESGDAFALAPLVAGQALMEVLRHTYLVKQYAPLYGFKQHMERAARVVATVPLFRLTRPKDLARLPELVEFVEANVR